jgi:hypothetical protein
VDIGYHQKSRTYSFCGSLVDMLLIFIRVSHIIIHMKAKRCNSAFTRESKNTPLLLRSPKQGFQAQCPRAHARILYPNFIQTALIRSCLASNVRAHEGSVNPSSRVSLCLRCYEIFTEGGPGSRTGPSIGSIFRVLHVTSCNR